MLGAILDEVRIRRRDDILVRYCSKREVRAERQLLESRVGAHLCRGNGEYLILGGASGRYGGNWRIGRSSAGSSRIGGDANRDGDGRRSRLFERRARGVILCSAIFTCRSSCIAQLARAAACGAALRPANAHFSHAHSSRLESKDILSEDEKDFHQVIALELQLERTWGIGKDECPTKPERGTVRAREELNLLAVLTTEDRQEAVSNSSGSTRHHD